MTKIIKFKDSSTEYDVYRIHAEDQINKIQAMARVIYSALQPHVVDDNESLNSPLLSDASYLSQMIFEQCNEFLSIELVKEQGEAVSDA